MELDDLRIQCKGRGETAPKDPTEGWKDTDLEFLFQNCKIAQEVIQLTGDKVHPIEYFDKKNVEQMLLHGEVIYTPVMLFRAVVGEKTCPLCGGTFEGLGAISRRDNETEICSVCGTREAMEDMSPEKK
ncbi:hypothetical protein PP175_26310 (plasmid) [Aneurinibacillus sp. Ricciae_BoGa-3]|uniref:hypothetical protein n=1 Tax=Aneurinibacillus sp. Ricciae_BoGa-3 TaxID=3022697 RepID=UPI002342850B|nr:hypothetical protein [Aneurinibacillus sp. Ricciae_BoGa-3]WCK57581.1 hypothetical protein PP175_26310 [Aneurinibacillus sp. Ricciae_BoGa-3]